MTKKLTAICFACLLLVAAGCGKKSTMYYDAAMAYLENGQYAEAYENFELSVETEAKDAETLRGLGISLIHLGEYEKAAEVLVEALSLNYHHIQPIDYDINFYLGYAYRKIGRYEDSVNCFSGIISLKDKETDAFYQRALTYLAMGEATLADEDINVVIRRNPGNYDLCLRLYFDMKEVGASTAADSFLKATLESSDKRLTDYNRGRMYFYLGDYSNARVYLEKAKDLSDPNTYLMLGKTYEAINDYAYASTLYTAYLDNKGNNAEVYNQLGICRSKAGEYESAVTAFGAGLNLNDPSWNKTLMYNEAVAYEYLHDFATAKEKFKAYYDLYPKDETTKRELEFLETR